MTKIKLLTAVGLAVILTAAYASARQARSGPEGAPGRERALPENLSAEQRTAIREIAHKYQKEMVALRAEMEAERLELEELIRTEAGRDAIFAKLDEVGALRTEMMKKRLAMRLEIRAQLTDEQKERFDQRRATMGRERAGREGPGRKRFD
ncbi:MAG: periplasmic heavy metal sensor [candidate division Zixibacteria bacterium]|nr:periplasmic heavy metal sensor [candidate division Zixibacteria bacterium]